MDDVGPETAETSHLGSLNLDDYTPEEANKMWDSFVEAEVNRLEKENKELKQEIKDLKDENETSKNQVAKLTKEKKSLVDKNTGLTITNDRLEKQLQKCRDEVGYLEALASSIQSDGASIQLNGTSMTSTIWRIQGEMMPPK
jgi:predicted RNase H-like nuclease (RuvC/YqgF family)